MQPLFDLGHIVATPGALSTLTTHEVMPTTFLARHHTGDWGEVDDEDSQTNQDALEHGGRIMSVYSVTPGVKIWVITEADRSATTILLPSEY